MVLYLNESDVEELLAMADAIEALRDTFEKQGDGNTINNPRQRIKTGKSMLHYLAAALPHLGVMGYKAYTSSAAGLKFRVFLHDIESGDLLSVMDGNHMGMIRTGAVTGLATSFMARKGSAVLGVFGTGFQAKGQIRAVCEVRDIKKIIIYGRDRERRLKFCDQVADETDAEVIPAENPDEAVTGSDIIVTATTSSSPVFDGKKIRPGTHINAIGGNFLFKREIDDATVRSSRVIAVESVEQSKMEAGELVAVVDKGKLHWENVKELGYIVSGRDHGRFNKNDITLFKSVGIAIEDICIAWHLYNIAVNTNRGKRIGIAP